MASIFFQRDSYFFLETSGRCSLKHPIYLCVLVYSVCVHSWQNIGAGHISLGGKALRITLSVCDPWCLRSLRRWAAVYDVMLCEMVRRFSFFLLLALYIEILLPFTTIRFPEKRGSKQTCTKFATQRHKYHWVTNVKILYVITIIGKDECFMLMPSLRKCINWAPCSCRF